MFVYFLPHLIVFDCDGSILDEVVGCVGSTSTDKQSVFIDWNGAV